MMEEVKPHQCTLVPDSPEALTSHARWDTLAHRHFLLEVIQRLQGAGIRIESHTHNHPDMRTLSMEQMEAECVQADSLIEQRLGRRPRYFAYPFGYHNRAARDFAGNRYSGTVTTELRPLHKQVDCAALPRLDSYYLQSEGMIRNIESPRVRCYLAARNVLRNLRGSQCRAGCD